ncbi:helix-turn-helix transcriptional regulator [Elizabethkingia anophelis]|nr:LuxR C-terminal-related transcriptional regulator [Elizabethkingia anophelis]WJJ99630.1 LuxR C-terminal-related transcriptional regulator [Elizabethkingia anophelis]
MIKLNFSSKEIANNTFIQHKSVQQKKHRLRKKLNVPTDQDLYVFFQDLD